MVDGIQASRKHRRDAHAGELPEKPTSQRERQRQAIKQARARADREAEIARERRESVLRVLEDADHPLSAAEIAKRLGHVSPQTVGAHLGHAETAIRVGPKGGHWWLASKGDAPSIPERRTRKPDTPRVPTRAESEKRARFQAALERLRGSGRTEVTSEEVAREAGMTAIGAGKMLRASGFEQVATTQGRKENGGGRAVWSLLEQVSR